MTRLLTRSDGLTSNLVYVLRMLLKEIEENAEISQDDPVLVDLKAYLICLIVEWDLQENPELGASYPGVGPFD